MKAMQEGSVRSLTCGSEINHVYLLVNESFGCSALSHVSRPEPHRQQCLSSTVNTWAYQMTQIRAWTLDQYRHITAAVTQISCRTGCMDVFVSALIRIWFTSVLQQRDFGFYLVSVLGDKKCPELLWSLLSRPSSRVVRHTGTRIWRHRNKCRSLFITCFQAELFHHELKSLKVRVKNCGGHRWNSVCVSVSYFKCRHLLIMIIHPGERISLFQTGLDTRKVPLDSASRCFCSAPRYLTLINSFFISYEV